MTLANPIMLWSLLGITIPIAIHLLSRKEGQVIRMGSIRHVQETSTQQFKGIKLNEIFLLALRCAMIAVFSLLLSGLQCAGVTNEKWVVIENGLLNDPSIESIVDSLKKEGYEQHQLADGFPQVRGDSTQINYWGLAERLRKENLKSAVVLASNRLENFKGKRTPLDRHIKWISIPVSSVDYELQATQVKDSVLLQAGHTNADETYFQSQTVKSSRQVSSSLPDSIRVLVVFDKAYEYDRKILVTALQAIANSFPVKMKITESNPLKFSRVNSDWLLWLSNEKTPDVAVPIIQIQVNNSNELLARTSAKTWAFTKRLNEEVALTQNLTLQLAHLIIPCDRLEKIAQAKDKRVMPDSMAWSTSTQIKPAGVSLFSADHFLTIFLFALLLLERTIAFKRSQ